MLKNKLIIFLDAIVAGILIGIGDLIYLTCSNKIVSAFLFSIGLITILIYKFKLYTGAIGYAKLKDALDMLIIIIGNIIGISFLYFACTDNIIHIAEEIVINKISVAYYLVFIRALICGILIYVAVDAYKTKPFIEALIVIILCIASFILCGAEHCVADIGYIFAAHKFDLNTMQFIAILIAGNSIGSLMFNLVKKIVQ